MNKQLASSAIALLLIALLFSFKPYTAWQSKFVKQNVDGSLQYVADEKGNIFPDFSRVGYYFGDKEIPDVAIVKTLAPSGDAERQIQSAIDELSKQPVSRDGFRGT